MFLNDIWGWTSPLGQEYALIGTGDGMSVVRVTNPLVPEFIGIVLSPAPQSGGNLWGDVGVFNVETGEGEYEGYAYFTTEADDTPINILALNQLDAMGPAVPGTPGAEIPASSSFMEGGYASAHNIYVNQQSGYAYVAGVHLEGEETACDDDPFHPARFNTLILNLNEDPLNPTIAACVADAGEHDFYVVNYRGPDKDYRNREIAFVFDGRDRDARTGSRPDSTPGQTIGGMTEIWDVTDKDDIKVISSFLAPGICFSHQGWTESNRHEYLLINDELDELRDIFGGLPGLCDGVVPPVLQNSGIYIMDIRDLDNPVFQERFAIDAPGEIDHNFVRHANRLYWAVYNAGSRVIEMRKNSGKLELREIGRLDSEPRNVPIFFGQWGIFPFAESETIIASDINNGLMVMEYDPGDGGADDEGWGASASAEEIGAGAAAPGAAEAVLEFLKTRLKE